MSLVTLIIRDCVPCDSHHQELFPCDTHHQGLWNYFCKLSYKTTKTWSHEQIHIDYILWLQCYDLIELVNVFQYIYAKPTFLCWHIFSVSLCQCKIPHCVNYRPSSQEIYSLLFKRSQALIALTSVVMKTLERLFL